MSCEYQIRFLFSLRILTFFGCGCFLFCFVLFLFSQTAFGFSKIVCFEIEEIDFESRYRSTSVTVTVKPKL